MGGRIYEFGSEPPADDRHVMIPEHTPADFERQYQADLQALRDRTTEGAQTDPYFDPELRAAARSFAIGWGSRDLRRENEAVYLALAAKRGLSPEEARDLLPILNSNQRPPTQSK